jgi:hypothetical protein
LGFRKIFLWPFRFRHFFLVILGSATSKRLKNTAVMNNDY